MARRRPQEWSPRPPKGAHELGHWLQAVALIGGEGRIDLGDRGPVYVAIVHDASGFNPGAAIAVDQNPYHNLSNEVIQTAFEILQGEAMKDKEHVEEVKAEWGERWEEILTEAFDGRVWTFEDPADAANLIRGNPRASELVEIDEPEPE